MVLKNLRRVLDVFQPEIFERDIDSMIEATKPKAQRKAEGSSMGFWERRRHIKEAKSMLRVGAQVENLHEALLVVAKQAEQWHMFVPHAHVPDGRVPAAYPTPACRHTGPSDALPPG